MLNFSDLCDTSHESLKILVAKKTYIIEAQIYKELSYITPMYQDMNSLLPKLHLCMTIDKKINVGFYWFKQDKQI